MATAAAMVAVHGTAVAAVAAPAATVGPPLLAAHRQQLRHPHSAQTCAVQQRWRLIWVGRGWYWGGLAVFALGNVGDFMSFLCAPPSIVAPPPGLATVTLMSAGTSSWVPPRGYVRPSMSCRESVSGEDGGDDACTMGHAH